MKRRPEMRKKLTGKALARFEAERDVWKEVLEGIKEIKRNHESEGRRRAPQRQVRRTTKEGRRARLSVR
jgi:hypothetical protein